MGEHLLCKQGVIGSIPFTSTRVAPTLDPRPKAQSARVRACMARALCALDVAVFAAPWFFNNLEEVINTVGFDLHA